MMLDIPEKFRGWLVYNQEHPLEAQEAYPRLDFSLIRELVRSPLFVQVVETLIAEYIPSIVPDPDPTPSVAQTLEPSAVAIAEDAGIHLPGARKHLWTPGARVTGRDLVEIEKHEEGVAYKYITKVHVLGPFDWVAEQETGVEPGAAVLKEKIWRSVAARPGNHWESRRLYVLGADWLKAELGKLKTRDQVIDFVHIWQLATEGEGVTEQMTGPEVVSRLELTLPHRQERGRYGGGSWSSINVDPPDVKADIAALRQQEWEARVQGRLDRETQQVFDQGIRLLGEPYVCEISPVDLRKHGFETITRMSKDYRLTFKAPEYETQRDENGALLANPRGYLLGLAGLDNASVLREIKAQQLAKLVARRNFGTASESSRKTSWEELMKEAGARVKAKAWIRATTDQRREGPPTLRPKVIGAELISTYGFNGDQFGESVTQEERHAHRALAWDAFFDLASITGLPHPQIGGTQRLGIAFGARGQGRFAAHYESVNRVTLKYFPIINLTNTRGDGSLAHEWGHFLDHHLAREPERLHVSEDNTIRAVFASEIINTRSTQTPLDPSVAMALAEVMHAIRNAPPLGAAAREGDRKQRLEDMGGLNEQLGVLNRLIKAEEIGWPEYRQRWKETKAAFRAGRKGDSSKTRYLRDAETLGEYWSRGTELFARAFESWVEDELTGNNRINTYLVYGTQRKYEHRVIREGVEVGPLEPYPQDEERVRINAAMRKLMAAVAASTVLQAK